MKTIIHNTKFLFACFARGSLQYSVQVFFRNPTVVKIDKSKIPIDFISKFSTIQFAIQRRFISSI